MRPDTPAGLRFLEHPVHHDTRGSFAVLWNREDLAASGVTADFLQDNLIRTHRGTLRGLHYQSRRPQGKLLTVLCGEVFEVAVDLRPESPTFGCWHAGRLAAGEHRSLWLPPGFAHGFLALSDEVVYLYKVTAAWDPEEAHVLAWDDPELAIPWPVTPGRAPVLSDRDREGRPWSEVRAAAAAG